MQTSGLCPQSLNRHVESRPGLHVGDNGPLLSLCPEKPGVTVGLQFHPALSPTDVPRDVRCTGCSIQQPAGEGALHSPPLLSWGFSESKMYPVPQEPFLVHRQGVCMRAHAAGVGAVSVCPLPSALLLPSDCDHCPCCLLSRPLPPPLHQRSWYNQLPIL